MTFAAYLDGRLCAVGDSEIGVKKTVGRTGKGDDPLGLTIYFAPAGFEWPHYERDVVATFEAGNRRGHAYMEAPAAR